MLQCIPSRSRIAASKHSIAECSAVNNAFSSSVNGNAWDLHAVQTDLSDPAFIATLNHGEATSSSQIDLRPHP
jgi:hypothetical protein